MNFLDLMKKMQAIEENAPTVAPTKDDMPGSEEGVDECGMMPMSVSSPAPKQQDNVTMNVSMNGSGAGGIRDLMGILKNIENGGTPMDPHPHNVDKLFGGDDHAEIVIGDDYANSAEGASGQEVYGIDAVTQTGDDLASKGGEAPKVNGGGNPMQETLVGRLSQMYQEIKESSEKVPPMPVAKNTSTHGMRDAWMAKYGKTHNANGTQKEPGMTPNADQSAAEVGRLSDVAGMNAAGKRVPPMPVTKNTSTHGMRDAWMAKYGKTHNANGTPKSASTNEAAKSDKFNPLKHVKNPTKGEKEAAKDVKRGSYADRAAMLKSAEADGRLKEGEKKTMSRAAKGYEKYGKEGMAALAKAGKEGKDLDKVRDKYNKYD